MPHTRTQPAVNETRYLDQLLAEGIELGIDAELLAGKQDVCPLQLTQGKHIGILLAHRRFNYECSIPIRIFATCRTIIKECRIEFPWDRYTAELTDMSKYNGCYYVGHTSFPASQVLNDRFEHPLVMCGGSHLEGVLLVAGCEQVPQKSRNGVVAAEIALIDIENRAARTEILLAARLFTPTYNHSLRSTRASAGKGKATRGLAIVDKNPQNGAALNKPIGELCEPKKEPPSTAAAVQTVGLSDGDQQVLKIAQTIQQWRERDIKDQIKNKGQKTELVENFGGYQSETEEVLHKLWPAESKLEACVLPLKAKETSPERLEKTD